MLYACFCGDLFVRVKSTYQRIITCWIFIHVTRKLKSKPCIRSSTISKTIIINKFCASAIWQKINIKQNQFFGLHSVKIYMGLIVVLELTQSIFTIQIIWCPVSICISYNTCVRKRSWRPLGIHPTSISKHIR